MRCLVGLTAVLLAMPAHAVVSIEWIEVGDPGNSPDGLGSCWEGDCGAVPYTYYIAKYEVTNSQYAEFLNAKAATSDPFGLFNETLGAYQNGGILREEGPPGEYTYFPKPGYANKPVSVVSFYDAVRFANWLHNGQGDGDTENGAYTLLGGTPTPTNGGSVARNPEARVFIPTESEWYKAAYYDGPSATYFQYPAGSNVPTVCAAPGSTPNTGNCGYSPGPCDCLTEVGAYTHSASPYGTFDQGGNVNEWNQTLHNSPGRGFRGGQWDGNASELASSSKQSNNPAGDGDSLGFRVASYVPEADASSLSLASLACLVALGRRRSRGRSAVNRPGFSGGSEN